MAEVFCDLFVVDDDGIVECIGETFITSSLESIGAGLAERISRNGFVHEFYLRRDLQKVVNKAEEFIPLLSSYMAFVLFQKVLAEVYFTWLVIISR